MRKWITIMAAFEILSATASMAAPPTPGPSPTPTASTTASRKVTMAAAIRPVNQSK